MKPEVDANALAFAAGIAAARVTAQAQATSLEILKCVRGRCTTDQLYRLIEKADFRLAPTAGGHDVVAAVLKQKWSDTAGNGLKDTTELRGSQFFAQCMAHGASLERETVIERVLAHDAPKSLLAWLAETGVFQGYIPDFESPTIRKALAQPKLDADEGLDQIERRQLLQTMRAVWDSALRATQVYLDTILLPPIVLCVLSFLSR